jgi:hypothetical protein
VYEICEIDGSKSNKVSTQFDELSNNGIGSEYYLDKFNISIRKGERHYVNRMMLNDVVDLGYDFVEENNTRVMLVNIKAKPEDTQKSNQKLQIIHVPFNKSEVEVVNTIELVMERIKREFEQGKQNVLIIYNFSELVRLINLACEGSISYERINAKAVNEIYNLLYLSKFFSEDMCCSVICIDNNGTPRDLKNFMELDLCPLFTNVHETIEKK